MNKRFQQNIYHGSVDPSWMIGNVTRIKSRRKISVGVSTKLLNNILVWKNIFLILLYVIVEKVNI